MVSSQPYIHLKSTPTYNTQNPAPKPNPPTHLTQTPRNLLRRSLPRENPKKKRDVKDAQRTSQSSKAVGAKTYAVQRSNGPRKDL